MKRKKNLQIGLIFTYFLLSGNFLFGQTLIDPARQIKPTIREFPFYGIVQGTDFGFSHTIQSGQTNPPSPAIIAQEGPYSVLNFPACTTCNGSDDSFAYFIISKLPDGFINNSTARVFGTIRTTDTSVQYSLSVATSCNSNGVPNGNLNIDSDIIIVSSSVVANWVNFTASNINLSGCDENSPLFVKVIREDNVNSIMSLVLIVVSVKAAMQPEF